MWGLQGAIADTGLQAEMLYNAGMFPLDAEYGEMTGTGMVHLVIGNVAVALWS